MVIDINVFIYVILWDLEFNVEVRKLLVGLERWIVLSIVFYEFYWFFREEGYKSEEINNVIFLILNSLRMWVICDIGKYMKCVLEFIRNLKWFNDMVILVMVEDFKRLVIYDKRLKKEVEKLEIKILF